MRAYNNAAYVDLGVGNQAGYRDYTRECAEYLNWKHDILEGHPGLVQRFVEGDWEGEDFLVVQPGHVIRPSHDETVVKAVPAQELE